MANDFDWNYEETKRDFEPEQIPNGDYRMIIRGAEKAMSKDIIKPKKMIKLKLGVSEEELEDLTELMEEIKAKEDELKLMKEKVDKVKEILYGTMEKKGVKTVDRRNLKITYVAPSSRTSVDSKKLEKEEPEIYKKYVKTTTVAGSIKITLMGDKNQGRRVESDKGKGR